MRFPIRAVLLLSAAPAANLLAQGAGWQTFGPALFQVSAVATGPNDSIVYAAGSDFAAGQSAIFQSSNGGFNWSTVVQAAAGEFYSDILVDPGNPSTLYAAAPSNDGTTKIYGSVDTGASWTLSLTIPIFCVPSFAPGIASGSAFVSCDTLLYGTTNSGQTWQQLVTPFTEATRLAAGPGGILLGYGVSHIFKSPNAGASWTLAGSAPAACPGLTALAVSPANSNVLVAGTGVTGAGGFQCGGIYRSTDGGSTWSAGSLSGVYVSDVEFDPNDTSRVYASSSYIAGILPPGGVYNSSDSGVTWSSLQLPQNGAAQLALSATGDQLYAATPLGVYALAIAVVPPSCTPDDVTLCLDGGRFRVRATWVTREGDSGPGHAHGLTGDTGDFWFFNSTNVEVIIKVLEGCSNNSHRWVFASGLTDVMVTLTVTDIDNGATWTRTNPLGTPFAPIQDTLAFPCN